MVIIITQQCLTGPRANKTVINNTGVALEAL